MDDETMGVELSPEMREALQIAEALKKFNTGTPIDNSALAGLPDIHALPQEFVTQVILKQYKEKMAQAQSRELNRPVSPAGDSRYRAYCL